MTKLAGCVILDEDGRMLLSHRVTPELTQWELPGGKIEPGETPEEAAIRELKEELGVTVEILGDLGTHAMTDHGHELDYSWFLAIITAGKPRPLEAKFDAVRYFNFKDLINRTDLSANARELLREFRTGIGPLAQSKLRRTRNEIIIQRENRRIKDLAATLLDQEALHRLPLSFACECSDLECAATITLTASDYAAIHDHIGWFGVRRGHEQLDIEHVVATKAGADDTDYHVVEKAIMRSGQILDA